VFVMVGMAANTAFVSLQSVVLIPLYVRVIGARLYGSWLGSGDVLSWMLVSDLGVADLLVQRIGAARGRGDDRAVGEWFGTGVVVLSAVGVLLGLAGVGGSFLLPRIYGLQGAEAHSLQRAFALAAGATGVTVVFNAFYGYARAVQRTAGLALASSLSTLAAFVTSLVMALSGFGLAAIAYGFVARAVVLLLGVGVSLAIDFPPAVLGAVRFRRSLLGEMVRSVPATGMAAVAYVGMSQSELLIVSLTLGPELATAYMLNRKAIDLARSFADTVVWGSFGSFAHLVGSDQRHRALEVYRELLSVRTALAVAAGAGFLALNRSFVSVWVGPSHYQGLALSAVFALQAVVAGNGFLVNYLYRASGKMVEGSLLLVAESALRVGLMVALAASIGLVGVPLAGVVTGGAFMAYTQRRLREVGASLGAADRPLPQRYWAVCGAVLGAALALGAWVAAPRWVFVLGGGAVVAAAGMAALVPSNGHLMRYVPRLTARLGAVAGEAR
jgi:O-antigen/teichoic acid export membrane protein